MVTHGVASEHPVVLSFSDLSVWCYLCEAYVHHQVTLTQVFDDDTVSGREKLTHAFTFILKILEINS